MIAPRSLMSPPRRQYADELAEPRSPMPLWLSELLEDPSLGAEVVAGTAGVDLRGPIRWAHISELPDPTPWLEGGELLLTTGLGIRDDPDAQRRFAAGLSDRGVVAVGFGMGVSLDHVPQALIEACDAHDLPLFTMPYEIPFIAVSRRVAHHAFEQHYATLQRAVGLHRQVLHAVTSQAGIAGVLEPVAREMNATLVAFDFAGTELGRVDLTTVATDLTSSHIWQHTPRDRTRSHFAVEGRVARSASVVVNSHLEAIVVAVTQAELLEHEELLFEQGLTGVSLELARNRSIRDAHRARVDELFEDVVSGRATHGLVERRLANLGVTTHVPFRVLAIVRDTSAPDAALCALVEDALAGIGPPVVGQVNDRLFALVGGNEPADQAAERIADAAQRRGWSQVRIGRSRRKSELEAMRAAFREARVALQVPGNDTIHDVEELGLSGLLAGVRDDLGAADFVARVLGSVIEHDNRESSQLIATLRAYLQHGCRPGPAAETLCIHRHTLSYRLDRIQTLTGRDPRHGSHLIEFGLALELMSQSDDDH